MTSADVDEDPSGLVLLGRHLAASKLEAAERESQLHNRIKRLKDEKKQLSNYVEDLKDGMEHAQSEIHQLRLENSKKWRVQERDDWRSLVAAIQEDRKHLQEENEQLQCELEELQRVRLKGNSAPQDDSPTQQESQSPSDSTGGEGGEGSPDSSSPSIDIATARQRERELRRELAESQELANQQRILLQSASVDLDVCRKELVRLREELDHHDVGGGKGVGGALQKFGSRLGSYIWLWGRDDGTGGQRRQLHEAQVMEV